MAVVSGTSDANLGQILYRPLTFRHEGGVIRAKITAREKTRYV